MLPPLPVAGFTPFTTIDYPGRLSAVVFCQGCPWRCPYCHNAAFRSFSAVGEIPWTEVVRKLWGRRGWIEAVVFSGGEPTAHPGLGAAMEEVREMGFDIGLHTAGVYPEAFRKVVGKADWVGFDVKAPFGPLYDRIAGTSGAAQRAFESFQILLASGKPYQLRTTVDPRFMTSEDVREINAEVGDCGAAPVTVQTAQPLGLLAE